MISKGSIIIIAGLPGDKEIFWVIVSQVIGPLRGYGYLCETEEGNIVLIRSAEGTAPTNFFGATLEAGSTSFVLDHIEETVLRWLVRNPSCMIELPRFTEYIKKNFGVFLETVGLKSSPYKTSSAEHFILEEPHDN